MFGYFGRDPKPKWLKRLDEPEKDKVMRDTKLRAQAVKYRNEVSGLGGYGPEPEKRAELRKKRNRKRKARTRRRKG